jgi:hypothetical protein|tara:strand:+ start:264 stop:548 length:285 start_codon:yes stop_codon:yes gene_type:complete
MIVEIALKDFFDEASDTWIMDDDGTLRGPVRHGKRFHQKKEGGDPIVFHADSFLDMVSGTNAILKDRCLVEGNIESIKINSVTLAELNGKLSLV